MVAPSSRRFLPGLPLFYIFTFIAVFLTLSCTSMPSCVKDCNRKFANNAALSRHHKTCPVLKVIRHHSQEIRRDKGIGKSIQDTTMLPTRKQRLMVCDCSSFKVVSYILQANSSSKGRPVSLSPAAMDVDSEVEPPEESLDTPSTPPPLQTQSGRPRRNYQMPKRFRDNLPEPPAPILESSNPNPESSIRRVILIIRDRLVTILNSFGIWRDYPERPSVDPDAFLTTQTHTAIETWMHRLTPGPCHPQLQSSHAPPTGPFWTKLSMLLCVG